MPLKPSRLLIGRMYMIIPLTMNFLAFCIEQLMGLCSSDMLRMSLNGLRC